MTFTELAGIKKQTRLALPSDDTYLYRLGVALYGFASINSFMIEIISSLNQTQCQNKLLSLESGKILDEFRQILTLLKSKRKHKEIHKIMKSTADLFEKLNTERNDFVHSYPITNKKEEQILHRRQDCKKKYFEINNEFLDRFISDLHNVSSGLYKIRDAIRADKPSMT